MNKHTDIESPQWLSLDLLEENEGQLFGLPANPREIAPEKFELLKADIQKYPQFLQYNALKVYPLDNGHYIVIGGNMRCRALKELDSFDKIPCIVIPKETHVEELKAYIILDNSNFGRWDWPALTSEEWNSEQLQEWGVECDFLDESFFREDDDTSSDLNDYNEPQKEELECPHCHHIDSKGRFKKVKRDADAASLEQSEPDPTSDLEL